MAKQPSPVHAPPPIVIEKASASVVPMTVAVYGPPKVGKTWFACTFPRPVVLAVGPERGRLSLGTHPNRESIDVIAVPQPVDPKNPQPRMAMSDMEMALRTVREQYQQRGWRTVVIDTASIYADMVRYELSAYGQQAMWARGDDNKWLLLQAHLVNIRDVLQGLPLHVVWVFHVKDITSGERIIRREPALVGGALQKLQPTFNLLCYLEKVDKAVIDHTTGAPTGQYEVERRLWTRCPSHINPPFEVGSHLDGALVEGCYVPHFDSLASRLQGIIATD